MYDPEIFEVEVDKNAEPSDILGCLAELLIDLDQEDGAVGSP